MKFLLCTLTLEVRCQEFHRNHVIWRTKIMFFWLNGNDSKQPYCCSFHSHSRVFNSDTWVIRFSCHWFNIPLSSKSSDWTCFVRLRLCHLSMIDMQLTTKNEYYDHITLLYLETRRYHYQSIIFVCLYLYFAVVIFIDY